MKKAGIRILIAGLICLIGPYFGFTYRGQQNEAVEVSQTLGLIAVVVGGLMIACSNDNKPKVNTQAMQRQENANDEEEYECHNCGKLVKEGIEKCPYCGEEFDWDDNEQDDKNDYKIIYQDKDNVVYSDDYYWDYCNNLEPLDAKMKKTVFDFVTGLYKTIDEKETTFIKYNDIHNYNDYHNSMKMFVYCISNIAKEQNEKYNNMILTITKYYVKYYTKYILKYGDNDDKSYLSKAISLLKSANIGTNEDEELVVYSDEYYLDYAKSIQPLSKETKDTMFNMMKETEKYMKIKAPIKQYSSINTRQEYLDSVGCVIACIEIYIKMKDVEKTTLFVLYFVKYYTKIILKYGTDEDKLFLSKHVRYLQELNIGKK